MASLATTKMTSKGQVVIPDQIRRYLGLKTGAQFVVMGEDDVVILKTIKKPSMTEFGSLIKRIRKSVKASGAKKADVQKALDEVRGKN
jgi:AbrB family looped-hinge helix DNA binding protein